MVASPTAAGPGSRTNSFGQAGGAVLSQTDARQAALRSTTGAPAPGPASQSALLSQQAASTLPALNALTQSPYVSAAARAARQQQGHLPPLVNAGRSGNALQTPLVTQRQGNKLSYSEKEARLRQGMLLSSLVENEYYQINTVAEEIAIA